MIPLMNVTRQYESLKEKLDQTALRILHSGKYIMGDDVEDWEKMFADYVGVKYAVGVGNGTDALVIALMAAGVGKGDEVITSAMSFFSTAEAIAMVGAVPVFVDCTGDTYTIDADQIEKKITEKTKAIIPVHLYGQCADMDKINALAHQNKLFVLEDAAQAAGARYKERKAGSLGDAACFSFFPTKNLGCAGDGGIITTDNEALYKKCLALRVHGSGVNGLFTYCENKRRDIPVGIDFAGNLPKYYNFVIGFNSRLDTLQAALLKEKLPYLERWNTQRRKIASEYEAKIINPVVEKPFCGKGNVHIYYVYVITVKQREAFRHYMEERGVGTGVYFPIPLHLQKAFEDMGYTEGDMPNAEFVAKHGVAIPMFPELTEEERRYVIECINSYVEEE